MMPVMDFRWGRVAYLASVILPIFEHVYGIPHEGICATAVRVLEAQKCLDPFHVPKINCC